MARSATIGKSILLSSFLALLSYIPFEKIAKGSLIFCAITFINDPIPPVSRIISVCGILFVLLLTKIEAKWKAGQEAEHYLSSGRNCKSAAESNEKND
jgi:hypothetical protein